MKTVLTYGTFDLFHIGHLRILERLKLLGDRLIVGVSTDEFNKKKGKSSLLSYDDRAAVVAAIKCVDLVIPEHTWEQKIQDIKDHDVDIFGIGGDWAGKFDFLKGHCQVVYLPRTFGISSSELKSMTAKLSQSHIPRSSGPRPSTWHEILRNDSAHVEVRDSVLRSSSGDADADVFPGR